MKSKIIAAAVSILLLAGCDDAQQPQYVQAPTTQYVQQQPPYTPQPVIVQEQSHTGDLVTGMMLGSMLSGGGNRTVVQRKTVVVNNYRPAPSYSAPSRSSSFGSFRRK